MNKEISANLLDKAALICITKHSGQRDKMGCAYFQHPMRVAMRCVTDEQKMVALLHDVIEDCNVTADELLAEGFPQEIVDGILAVTKREGESYEDFVARAKKNPLGRVVKMHDLEDNLDIFRLDSLSSDMANRYSKYLAAYRFLQADENTDNQSVLKTKDDLCSELRAAENKNIISRRNKDRSDYKAFRLVIRDINNTLIINESSIFDTLCALCRLIGVEKMSESGVKKGRYQYAFVRNSGNSNCYRQANNGWWVLSKISVLSVAFALNELFDKLNVHYVAAVVTRLK